MTLGAPSRPLVDQQQKQQLIMQKQIHQATSQMLRRPSHFSRGQGDMSRPVIQALLTQKSQGRLTGSALESWVDRFEVYHIQSCSPGGMTDVEEQFDALNREFEAEYASTVFDSVLPPHTPLDCTANKARVQRQKSFKSSQPSPCLPCLPSQLSPCLPSQLSLSPAGPPLASPRQRTYQQSSNVARQLKQEEASPTKQEEASSPTKQEEASSPTRIVLGREPDVRPLGATAARFPFLRRVTDSMARYTTPSRTLPSLPSPPSPTTPRVSPGPEPYYEEISVLKQRKKKTSFQPPSEPPSLPPSLPPTLPPSKPPSLPPSLPASLHPTLPPSLPALQPRSCELSWSRTPTGWAPVTCPSGSNAKDLRMAIDQEDPEEMEVMKESKTKPEEAGRPFERFHNWLFKSFTALVPWSVMKRVYWRREEGRDERFRATARRQSELRRSRRGT